MRNTYQDKHGTFYLRLLVPKVLHPHVTRQKVVQSLKTKDRRQAYIRSMEASLAFERWVLDMKKNYGIYDNNRTYANV
ncbi:DUF6538 domain-containing protein [Roseateles sp.]|uniref:DUF6538 domain-containing protein n=1 Tax=Roseateles sp. TaxID=1971397 RepID=UPI0039E82720